MTDYYRLLINKVLDNLYWFDLKFRLFERICEFLILILFEFSGFDFILV